MGFGAPNLDRVGEWQTNTRLGDGMSRHKRSPTGEISAAHAIPHPRCIRPMGIANAQPVSHDRSLSDALLKGPTVPPATESPPAYGSQLWCHRFDATPASHHTPSAIANPSTMHIAGGPGLPQLPHPANPPPTRVFHWAASGAMDLEMFYDGGLPEQNHLHAWAAAEFSQRANRELGQPMWRHPVD